MKYKNVVQDKFGRDIEPGDVLKVFHFVSRMRRKREYMYKWVLESDKEPGYLRCYHLNATGLTKDKGWFDPRCLEGRDFEIVQTLHASKLDKKQKSLCPSCEGR